MAPITVEQLLESLFEDGSKHIDPKPVKRLIEDLTAARNILHRLAYEDPTIVNDLTQIGIEHIGPDMDSLIKVLKTKYKLE